MVDKQNPFKPFITDFEVEAEKFLIKYGYEAALTTPQPINIRDIINRYTPLKIIDSENLSSDFSVQGIITFTSGIVQVYDWLEQEYVGFEVKEPTIFVDSDIVSDGYKNKVLAHEAFHWYKHRRYFVYQQSHSLGTGFAFRCTRRYSQEEFLPGWSDEETMEWQARKIAPMILMPRNALMNKARQFDNWEKGDILSPEKEQEALQEIANCFRVTKSMVAYRLRNLGYNISAVSIEGYSIPIREIHEKKTHYRIQRPDISLVEAFELYRSNKLFRSYINTGAFRYFKHGFTAIYQVRSADVPECLTFGDKLFPEKGMESPAGIMFHQNLSYSSKKTFTNTPQNAELLDTVSKFCNDFEQIHKRKAVNSVSANEMMFKYMQDAKWNTAIFQDKTLLAPMDYTRVQKPDHKFKMAAYVAMAVGLKLSITEFQNVIKQAGLSLKEGDKVDDAYTFVLTAMQGYDIDTCNDFLEQNGIGKLGTHTRNWGRV